jgi:myo-inositol 2-dehydrogenase / D-chiro-inositol 1-dehydrogenase
MENKTLERRAFLTGKAAAATGVMIMAPHLVRGSQANSALSVGLIGCGNRGMYVSGIFARNEYAKFTAICDIYEDRLKVGSEKFSSAKQFKSHEALLASDVDAVYIATPAALHPEHFESAVKAKKHIFMEKPAGVDAKGCKRVLEAARRADPTKRISMDFQQRYGKDYRKAHQLVTGGELGGLKMVRAAWLGSGPPIKSGHPADQEKIRNWFFYREMSGDMLIEQDCHNIDVIHWFTGMKPTKASGYASRQVRTNIGNIFDNLAFNMTYESGLVVSFSANQFGRQTGWSDVSETFICEKGTVNVSRQGYSVWRGNSKEVERVDTKYDITQDAVNEFIDGARNGKMENAGIWGAESTLMGVMALNALVKKQEQTWEQTLRG